MRAAHARMAPPPGQARLAPIRKLKVAFCIPHSCVTGGLKMLLEQVGGRPGVVAGRGMGVGRGTGVGQAVGVRAT